MVFLIRLFRAIIFVPIALTYLLLALDSFLDGAELYFGGGKHDILHNMEHKN